MNVPLLVTELSLAGLLVASASYVHFRGKVRHKFGRQLLDHSTFMAPYNTLVYLFSGTKNKPILDRQDFGHLDPLRDNWETIRDEVKVLYDEGHIKRSEKHNDVAFSSFFKRGWKRFYLKWYDDVLPSARELCPKTVALVQSIPEVNAALFAMLPPGGKLGEHRDPFAGSLRYHLGLITPNSDDCRIYVDGEAYAWRDGQDIVFDETYIHSVRNDTDQVRIILFCDVARPIRNPVVRGINRFVTNHLVKATSTQNEATEKVGLLNRMISPVFMLRDAFQRMKKWNRKVYYATKYAILLGILFLLVLPFVNFR
jgi:beta-hydroxylase